ncbi:adapter protein MecA 1/2 [Alicyclobacillus hesperidum]|uniref:Adapter protein MecA 1/2 n=1 Tax=Alicyclobacillus hesperidum TaxID=89784 RepID=A0A1H2XUL1_9BACL|nr:adaptor protein MecA [Alicyclobacillus hesperidum]SDW96521.1 adapter protein MecA 1/2 [Alicyclobacillus hesperidum]
MRVERIARDKVRIFISYDDLEERGIDRDEIWHNGKKVQDLFWDMMETAYMEVGFEIAGPISVEAFTMPTEGVVVIVTRIPSIPGATSDESDMEDDDDNATTLFSREPGFQSRADSYMVFSFSDFDDLVFVCHTLLPYQINTSLFYYKDRYELLIADALDSERWQLVASILSEYGSVSSSTEAVLKEYGKTVIAENALEAIVQRFPL